MKIPMAIRLAVMERREKLEAEISDLQEQLGEIDAWLAGESEERQQENSEIVPRGTIPPEPETESVDDDPEEPINVDDEPKKFSADDYTHSALSLPAEFGTKLLIKNLKVSFEHSRVLINTWTRRKWIERTGFAHYTKTALFPTGAETPEHEPEPEAEHETERNYLNSHDPMLDKVEEAEPTPEEAADVNALNLQHARQQFEKTLADKRRQLADVVDGSPSQTVLKDQIRKLENQILQLSN